MLLSRCDWPRMQVQLLFLSLASAVFGAQPIPGDLLKKLKKSRSLQDFMDVASVQARQGKIRRISIQSSAALMKANTMGASLLSLHSKSSGSAADDDLQSIMSLPQGGDTCTLQNICVRVPFASSDPGVIVYPTCFEVTRCVGSCCDEEESCHATAVEFVERPRVELVYMGNSRFMANQTLNVSVEQHLACGCRDCSLEGPAPQCEPGRVIGPSCDCECGNQLEKASCKGRNRWWNENSCTCGCEIFSCPPESTLNRAICECEQNDVVRIDEPDDNGDFQSDTSKLPRLKYRSRSQ